MLGLYSLEVEGCCCNSPEAKTDKCPPRPHFINPSRDQQKKPNCNSGSGPDNCENMCSTQSVSLSGHYKFLRVSLRFDISQDDNTPFK
eukprot:2043968-Amphidinium_carterae.1